MKNIGRKILKVFLVFSYIFSLSMQGNINIEAQENNVEIIDDNDVRFHYSDGSANNGGWDAGGSGEVDSTEHWSNTVGATVSISFNGTAFELYGKKASNHRMFSVSIDGGKEVECDAYAQSKTDNNALLYSSEDNGIQLDAGDHVAVVTILDKANEAASNVLGMNVAYAKVYGGDVTEPEFPGYSIVEDVKTTTENELFKVKYTGAWAGGESYYPEFHDGYEHYAHTGDYYEIRFVGTKAEIWATKDRGHGIYTVTIDGKEAGSADATSTSRTHQQLIYTSPELENTEHVMKVELEGQEDKAIQLDYLKIYHEEMSPTSIKLDKEEVTLIPGGSTKLNVSFEPWVATKNDIIWESSNPSVVSVENGVLTAAEVEEKQEVVITATSKENEKVSAKVKVTVDPALSFMNAYVGNEKLLETEENYEELKNGSGSYYEATAWKGDELNSKIVVTTLDKEVKNVEVTSKDFINENGDVLSSENIDIKWLKEIKANIGRGNSSAPVKNFPDVIYKGGAKNIEANDVQFAWVNINIPKDTKPGVYTGTIQVSADGLKNPFEFVYTVEVLNLNQPAPEATEIQVWQHPFAVANYYLGLGSKPTGGVSYDSAKDFYFTEPHFNLMRDSMKEYASIGGHDAVANIVEEAWNHQSYYNDESMVKWTKKKDGTFEFDYAWYDAWINFQIECGVLDSEKGIGQIKCYSMVPWNNQIAYFDEATGKTVKESHSPGTAGWKALWEPFLKDFMNHSKEMGWFDITYISMDERGLDQLEPTVDMIESIVDENGEHFKISSALNYAAPEYYDFTDRIDDISINLGNTGNVAQINALSDHRRNLGLTTTMYTCTGDYPSNFTISDPGDNYWDIWFTMTLGTDGYMRWAWDNYVYDMHGDTSYRYWEPGDGWFIYPMEREEIDENYNASFYSTPRYELFKQGIRDVAKAKYLLNSEEVSDELKAELKETVGNLKRPNATTSYGSKVAATQEDRMLVHSETKRALDCTTKVAREFSDRQEIVDKSELDKALKEAEKLDVNNYTASSKEMFVIALSTAKDVLANEEATQKEVDTALENLKNAIASLEYKEADYSKVEEAINKANSLDKNLYKDFSKVEEAINKVVKDLDITKQAEVDAMAKAINDAVNALEYKEADYSKVEEAINKANSLNKNLYKDFSKVEEAIDKVVKDLDITKQAEVDAMAKAINDAVNALEYKDADYSKVDEIISAIPKDLDKYTEESVKALNNALNAIVRDLDITHQEEVDEMAANLLEAIKELQLKDKQPTIPEDKPEKPETPGNKPENPGTPEKEEENKNDVQTGVQANTGLYATGLLIAAAGAGYIISRRKRKDDGEE